MLYLVKGMDDGHSHILFQDVEIIEHGTLQVEGICCVIASYGKYANVVATLAKSIRENLYMYHNEMAGMSSLNGWSEERLANDKVCKLLVDLEDDIRKMQNIVVEEENTIVKLITHDMEIAVTDAMALNGLRKCIEISKDMVAALVYIMQVTNYYVDIFGKGGKTK